jgi:hypothetical protein
MDILSSVKEVMAIGVTVTTGAVGDQVYPSGDSAVSKAAADAANVCGTLVSKNTKLDGTYEGVVETPFTRKVQAQCDGAIAAGEWVKIGAADGDTQTFKKWTPIVTTVTFDDPNYVVTETGDHDRLRIGMCLVGAADGAEGEFLLF